MRSPRHASGQHRRTRGLRLLRGRGEAPIGVGRLAAIWLLGDLGRTGAGQTPARSTWSSGARVLQRGHGARHAELRPGRLDDYPRSTGRSGATGPLRHTIQVGERPNSPVGGGTYQVWWSPNEIRLGVDGNIENAHYSYMTPARERRLAVRPGGPDHEPRDGWQPRLDR